MIRLNAGPQMCKDLEKRGIQVSACCCESHCGTVTGNHSASPGEDFSGQGTEIYACVCMCACLHGQFDRLCNLVGGAILAQVICACAYDYHRLSSSTTMGLQRFACVRVCVLFPLSPPPPLPLPFPIDLVSTMLSLILLAFTLSFSKAFTQSWT